jgi:uncharacterized repeat protein (TIGR01451 family)
MRTGITMLVWFVLMLGFAQSAAAASTADLAVSMAGDTKNPKWGGTITYSVTVTNLGPDIATGVTVAIGVSDTYANLGGACPDGSVSNRCDLGSLPPGERITVDFRVMACCPEPDQRIGVAVGSVWSDAETVDPVWANNEVRVETKLVGKARS